MYAAAIPRSFLLASTIINVSENKSTQHERIDAEAGSSRDRSHSKTPICGAAIWITHQ